MFNPFFDSKTSITFVAALLMSGCAQPKATQPREIVTAPLLVVSRTSLPTLQVVAGTVRSQTASTLAANVVGTVMRVSVSEGDRVRKGDVLVAIDAREPRAQADRARAGRDEVERAIDAATSNAQLAEATWRRYDALHTRGSASKQELEEATNRRSMAQAELARLIAQRAEARAAATQADAVLAYSSVRAPVDGVIGARFADPGAQAAPGVALLTIEEERATRVDASVPEGVVVHAGDHVVVEAGSQRIAASVIRVQPSVDRNTRSALVQLAMETPMRAGSLVRVSFATGMHPAITVPEAALVWRGQLTSVFVVGSDGIARMRLVTLGAGAGARIEILSGLDEGDVIVTAPERIREGMIVRSGA